MATYTELFDLRTNSALQNKVAVAVAVKAQSLIDGGTPTAAEIAWADKVLDSPLSEAKRLMGYVLAANKALDTSAILTATDAAIQSNVDAAVDALIAGGA